MAARWWAFAALLATGCYASNVVAVGDRAVAEDGMPTAWRPAVAADVAGWFQSARITGDAALTLRSVTYWFATDGRYSGAALVEQDDGLAFQTLNGRWQSIDGTLALDDRAPVPCDAAAGWLRIRTAQGDLVLQRRELR